MPQCRRLWQRISCTSPTAFGRRGAARPFSGGASHLLRRSEEELSLQERLELLCQLVPCSPSVKDERLLRLASEVLAQRHDLALSSLVEATKALQELGLREELGPLVSMASESASFLPGEVVLSFARTLAVTRHMGSIDVNELAVFKLLGEHVTERMFEAAPKELAEALLAIAVFCCSRQRRLADPALESPWHHGVFAATPMMQELRPEELLKCLRAYTLYFLEMQSWKGRAALLEDGSRLLAQREPHVLRSLLERLEQCLDELHGHSLVRALHCAYCLEEQGLLPEGLWPRFRSVAAEALGALEAELSVRDVGYAMQAVARWNPDLAGRLLTQVLHHVLEMTPQDALRILGATKLLPKVMRNAAAMDVVKAEVLRGLREFEASQLCSVLQCFVAIKAQEPDLLQSLGEAFSSTSLPPKQLSTALASLARLQMRDGPIFKEVTPIIVRDIIGFTHRDLCLCLWAMAKASQKDLRLCARTQQLYLEGQNSRGLNHLDVSMMLWSFSRLQWHPHPELLGRLTQQAVMGCPTYSDSSLLVTCLALGRMNFTRPPVLAPLFRNLYGRLQHLQDEQLALAFVLFSGSGVRDQAILSRMLLEMRNRLPRLQGRDFANVVMACFRSCTPSLMRDLGAYESLKLAVSERYAGLPTKLKLRIFLAAPSLFDLHEEELMPMVEALLPQLETMTTPELTRCLVGCARRQLVHRAFLEPLFQALREAREKMSPVDVVSCIYSVYVLNYWTPKFRRSLGYMLTQHVKAWRIPASRLRDVLPALHALRYWQRLPGPLQRAVWRIAAEDLRHNIPPPPKPDRPAEPAQREGWARFGLQRLERGRLRRLQRQAREEKNLSPKHGLTSLEKNPWEGRAQRREEEDFVESLREEDKEAKEAKESTAVDSFIRMVRRL